MALWTPAGESPLRWYQADTIGLADWANVYTWPDDSINANDAIATANGPATYRTGILNGLPIVRFSYVDFEFDNVLDTAAATGSIFVLCMTTDTTHVVAMLGNADGHSGSAGWITEIWTATTVHYAHHGASPEPTYNITSGNYHIHEFIRDGLSVDIGVNGTMNGASTISAYTPRNTGKTYIASNNSAKDWFPGDFAEIIIFDTVVDLDTRQKVEGYLAWKWGLEADLPVGHPYLAAAPETDPILPIDADFAFESPVSEMSITWQNSVLLNLIVPAPVMSIGLSGTTLVNVDFSPLKPSFDIRMGNDITMSPPVCEMSIDLLNSQFIRSEMYAPAPSMSIGVTTDTLINVSLLTPSPEMDISSWWDTSAAIAMESKAPTMNISAGLGKLIDINMKVPVADYKLSIGKYDDSSIIRYSRHGICQSGV